MLEESESLLLYGIVCRAVGVVVLITFASIQTDFRAYFGNNGIYPFKHFADKVKKDFPSFAERLWMWPSALWFNHSDAFMQVLIVMGMVSACLMVLGGELFRLGLVGSYVCLLSLDQAVHLWFPWDGLLFETIFLLIFFPDVPRLPKISLHIAPNALVAFSLRWLLFRLMFGFGKEKFLGTTTKDLGFLHGFSYIAPYLTKAGWYFIHAPPLLHQAFLILLFVFEIILPFGMFCSRSFRIVAALSAVSLMLGIQALANFSTFNILTSLLCLLLTEPDVINRESVHLACVLYHLFALPVSIITLGGNTWWGWSIVEWPALTQRHQLIRLLRGYLRFVGTFRLVSPFGVFPPFCMAPMRVALVLESSDNGIEWHSFRWKYLPIDEVSSPTVVAPYHPRLLQFVHYELYIDRAFFGACYSRNPYEYERAGFFSKLRDKVFNQDACVLATLFEPSEVVATRPRFVRVAMYALTAESIAAHNITGKWWKKRYIGNFLNATAEPSNQTSLLTSPEQFYWDHTWWKDELAQRQTTWIGQNGSLLQRDLASATECLYGRSQWLTFWHLIEEGSQLSHNWKDSKSVSRFRSVIQNSLGLMQFEVMFRRLNFLIGRILELQELQQWGYCSQLDIEVLVNCMIWQGRRASELLWQNTREALSKHLFSVNFARGMFYYAVVWNEEFRRQVIKAQYWNLMFDYDFRCLPQLPLRRLKPAMMTEWFRLAELCDDTFVNFPKLRSPTSLGMWTIESF